MHPALWISKTGLDAQQTGISVTAHNLANVDTTGFKKGRAVFDDTMYQKIRQPGAENGADSQLPSGLMLGTGVRITATQKDFQTGSPTLTNNPTHMLIDGRGFFQILQTDGSIAYTRDGTFQLDQNGNIVTSEGLHLQPSITVPNQAHSLTIGHDGTVSVTTAGTTTPTQIGSIQVADFINYAGLEPIGDNLYVETAASGAPQTLKPGDSGAGKILQNNLESSNVNVVEELINLIQGQRAYEINARAVETVDKMLQFITQVI